MTPSDDVTRPQADDVLDAALEPRVGSYRLVRELGQGGMGTVYLAVRDDDAFHKRVALKILKRGMDTDAIVRRFRTERQILAGLDHPNIARLLDGGTTPDGRPYLVMEYVDGAPLVEFAESRQLDTTARLEIFLQVASAVQYAHQNLVIHRDLKPANVLVTQDAVPKLLDFGIAKLLNPEMAGHTLAPTAAGLQLMTPEYASPEQVRGETVTTASDVYSLAVLLYELLTGRRPYRLTSRAVADIARVVAETEPLPPSVAVGEPMAPADADGSTTRPRTRPTGPADTQRLRRRLAGDLDNIVLKALSKEPVRRYASVDQFAEDVRRHLAGLPVLARHDTLGYRASKFVRRHRGAVTAAAAVFLALVAGLVGIAWQARVARQERARAEQRFEDVRSLARAFLFDLHDAIRDLGGSTPARQLMVQKGMEYLDKLARDAGDRPDLRRELAAGYLRVGDVQGRPLNPNLGDTAGALASYKKSVELYDSLGVTAGSPVELRRETGTALLRLSELLAASGDSRAAMKAVRRAIDLQRDIATDTTSSPGARRDLAVAYSRLGDMLSATGDTKAALEQQRLALGVMQALSATAPDDPNNLRQLGVAHHKVGNLLGNPNYPNLGDHATALAEMQQSVAVFDRASTRYPENAMFKRNLAVARSNSADILTALARRGGAGPGGVGPGDLCGSSTRGSDNAAARNDLAIAHFKFAEMLEADGKLREALASLERASTIQDQLAAAAPDSARARAETATNDGLRGRLLAKLGQRAAAMASLQRAVNVSRELSRGSSDNVELRVSVALALIERGDAALVLGRQAGDSTADRQQAARDYTEAAAILAALQQQGVIEGTDLETLAGVRQKLEGVEKAR